MDEDDTQQKQFDSHDFLGPDETSDELTVVYQDVPTPHQNESSEIPAEVTIHTPYRLLSLIGRGGMGLVYRAFDLKLQRDVAIKVLRHDFVGNEKIVRRFKLEALIKSSLQHPGIAPIYGSGTCVDGRPFYAMKLLDGQTLAHILAKPELETGLLSVLAQVCQTMAYAHSRGVVHLDLKPSNIMVGDFGRVHIIDWGLAQPIGDFSYLEAQEIILDLDSPSDSSMLTDSHSGMVRGTPAYMSPEQARGQLVDARSDVFSLGAILCEVLTGSAAYQGDDPRQLLRRAFRGATGHAFARLEQTECELWLTSLVKRCLDRDPKKRPADAGVLATELAHFQASTLELVESDMDRFFELSPDLFCIAGFDGCFRRVNSNFPRLTGRSEQELLSQPFVNFVHPDDRDRTLREMGKLTQGISVEHFRNRYIARNGSILHLEWTSKPVMSEGLIYAIARDVTHGN